MRFISCRVYGGSIDFAAQKLLYGDAWHGGVDGSELCEKGFGGDALRTATTLEKPSIPTLVLASFFPGIRLFNRTSRRVSNKTLD